MKKKCPHPRVSALASGYLEGRSTLLAPKAEAIELRQSVESVIWRACTNRPVKQTYSFNEETSTENKSLVANTNKSVKASGEDD